MQSKLSITAGERERFISALAVAYPISDTRFGLLRHRMKNILDGITPQTHRAALSAVACRFRLEFEAEQVWEPVRKDFAPAAHVQNSRRKKAVAAQRTTPYPPAERTNSRTG